MEELSIEKLKLFPIKLLILIFLLYLLFSNKSMKEYIRFCIKVGVYIFSLYLLYYNKIELCGLILLLCVCFDIITYTPKDTDDAEYEIEISIKDNYPIATVKLVDNKSGIVQAVYENENNKVIVCETSPYHFSANEEKEIEMYCYNLNNEKLSELKLVKYNFIEE